MKIKLIAFVLLSVALPALAQSRSDVESKILAMENAWNLAQKDHDSGALDVLVADTFINTDYDGTVQNKAQFLADAKDTSYKFDSVGNTNVSVFFYNGNTAVVTGTYHTTGSHKGKPFDSHGRFTDTWVMLNGKWLCVASATTHIQKAS
ncbi:MAG: nuclear transport factor 2 family protein [Terriglobales bacterium]